MIIPQLGYGGAEGAFLRVAGFLARHGDVTIALMARDYGNGDYATVGSETNLTVTMLDGDREPGRCICAKIMRWWRMLRRLQALKRSHDVAISFLSGANLLNAVAGPRGKTIVSVRGSKRGDSGVSRTQFLLWTHLLDPLTYWRSTRIVAASAGLASEIIADNRSAANQTLAIEGTVHADHLLELSDASIESDFEVFRSYRSVVTFGRLHKTKGFDFLLRAFAEVRRSHSAARLLLIGDGPELEQLLELSAELGLRGGTEIDPENLDVVFAGYRASPVRYVRLGQVFAMTSRREGLPNALIEALAAGVPILAADCKWGPRSVLSGPAEALGSGALDLPRRLTHGTLMPMPDSPGAAGIWADEIGKLLSHPVARKARPDRHGAVTRFDIEMTGPHWRQLIADLTDGPLLRPIAKGQSCL